MKLKTVALSLMLIGVSCKPMHRQRHDSEASFAYTPNGGIITAEHGEPAGGLCVLQYTAIYDTPTLLTVDGSISDKQLMEALGYLDVESAEVLKFFAGLLGSTLGGRAMWNKAKASGKFSRVGIGIVAGGLTGIVATGLAVHQANKRSGERYDPLPQAYIMSRECKPEHNLVGNRLADTAICQQYKR
ncbi:MAG: hypothetical protein OYH77_07015, partial [Pseudomonadota bacterium]|nr:hypothetical protein [Pseudomonadota bacterium]